MAERLSEVEARIGSVRQLSAVITAMRGIAAVRSHEASQRLDGLRTYAATIGGAIAQALAMAPPGYETPSRSMAQGARLLIILCAEQGFVGGFNQRIVEMAARILAEDGNGPGDLLLVGSHGLIAAEERGMAVSTQVPMAAHVDQLPALANRLVDLVFDRIERGAIGHVTIVHATPTQANAPASVVHQALIPFDFSRFPPASSSMAPLIHIPPAELLARLADEYVFSEICEALTLSYAAENEARMRAMVAARENVARKLDELTATSRLLRQDQITEEAIELAAGTRA